MEAWGIDQQGSRRHGQPDRRGDRGRHRPLATTLGPVRIVGSAAVSGHRHGGIDLLLLWSEVVKRIYDNNFWRMPTRFPIDSLQGLPISRKPDSLRASLAGGGETRRVRQLS